MFIIHDSVYELKNNKVGTCNYRKGCDLFWKPWQLKWDMFLYVFYVFRFGVC